MNLMQISTQQSNEKKSGNRDLGFSLIEVMVSVAIVGILALAMTSFMSNMFKEAKRMQQLASILDIMSDVRMYLQTGSYCTTAYANIDPTVSASGITGVTSVPNANPPPADRYAEGQSYANDTINISEINIQNLIRDNPTAPPIGTLNSDYYTGTVQLVFIINLAGQSGFNVARSLTLRVELLGYSAGAGTPNDNDIKNCTSGPAGSAVFSPWLAGAAGTIYYNGGSVGIGTATPAHLLDVAGDIADLPPSATNGYHFVSDKKLKENIRPIPGLTTVEKLRGVSFDWKNNHQSDVGVIAQEVEKVLPQIVSTNSTTGTKYVELSNLVAVLIDAENDLNKENLALKKRIEMLESRRAATKTLKKNHAVESN